MEISLRGNGPWLGISYESRQDPTTGRFIRLNNLYVSRDGSELVRSPGCALVAEPGYAQKFGGAIGPGVPPPKTIIAGATPLYHEKDVSRPSNPFYLVQNDQLNDLPEGWYLGSFGTTATQDETKLEVPIVSTGIGTCSIFISRIASLSNRMPIHGLIECLHLPVIVHECGIYYDAVVGSPSSPLYGQGFQPSIAMTMGRRSFDFDNPMTPSDFDYWEPTHHGINKGTPHIVQDVLWARDTANGYEETAGPRSERYWTKRIPRKVQLEKYDGRVIVAAPGYGCLFQALIDHEIMLDTLTSQGVVGTVESLGIPKGLMTTANIAFNTGGSPEISGGTTIYVRVAYLNSRTGEVGYVSEIKTATAPSGGPYRATVDVVHPRYVLRETDANLIQVWMSSKSSTGSAAALFPERISQLSWPVTTITIGDGGSLFPDVADVEGTAGPSVLQQMPMGSIWAKTLRGHLFTGGRIGRPFAQNESDLINVLDEGDVIYPRDGFQVSGKGIPPAYEGSLYATARTETGFPPGVTRLAKLQEAESGTPHRQRYLLERGVLSSLSSLGARPIRMQKQRVQFSPKEHPAEAPAPQSTIFDRKVGKDVIASGTFGDRLVVCTEAQTYVLTWGVNPIGADPQLVHPTIGCIAPDSMVETDVGLYWLSDRGPAMFDGASVTLVGRPIEDRFRQPVRSIEGLVLEQQYLRCQDRYLWNARGVYDSQRRRVLWFLRTDQHNSEFASAKRSTTIQAASATNPVQLTLLDFRFPSGVLMEVTITGDTLRPGLNGTWVATTTHDGSNYVLQIDAFDNSGGATGASGTVSWNVAEEQSKVGADHVLSLSLDTGSFTTEEFPSDRAIQGVSECFFQDGVRRLCVVEGSITAKGALYDCGLTGDIFGIDDTYADRMKENVSVTATEGPYSSGGDTFFKATGTDFRALLRFAATFYPSVAPWVIGYHAFVRSPEPDSNGRYTLKWWGELDRILDPSGDGVRLVANSAMPSPTWEAGDIIEIGCIHADFETVLMDAAALRGGEKKEPVNLAGLVLEHSVYGTFIGDQRVSWIFAEVWANGSWTPLQTEPWGHPIDVDSEVTVIRGGGGLGREFKLRATIISNSQVRLKDIRLDVR